MAYLTPMLTPLTAAEYVFHRLGADCGMKYLIMFRQPKTLTLSKLAFGCLISAEADFSTRYSLPLTRYFLLVTRYFLLVTRYFLLLTRYILLVTCYFLIVIHFFSLLIAFYLSACLMKSTLYFEYWPFLERVLELCVNTCDLNVSSGLRYCIISNYYISSIVWI